MNKSDIFTPEVLRDIFPAERADRFFDALFGDVSEGAYDISLHYGGEDGNRLKFEFHLKRRPGKCLACNLTYGLPDVFKRHPVIDVKSVVESIMEKTGGGSRCTGWELERTREVSPDLHVIPLSLTIE